MRHEAYPRTLDQGIRRAHPVHNMKTFTIDQANRALPLVRRIVQDIVDEYARWQALVKDLDVLAASSARSAQWAPASEIARLQHDIQHAARTIDGYVRELTELGIEMKGLDVGLVDFPGEIDGRRVYLCWRLGEPAVSHWHELDAGFAGRQPLAPNVVA